MELHSIDTVENIEPDNFKNNYYLPQKPLVITELAKKWPAYKRWSWDYFKEIVGDKKVGLYNNVKSNAYTPVNTARLVLLQKAGQPHEPGTQLPAW